MVVYDAATDNWCIYYGLPALSWSGSHLLSFLPSLLLPLLLLQPTVFKQSKLHLEHLPPNSHKAHSLQPQCGTDYTFILPPSSPQHIPPPNICIGLLCVSSNFLLNAGHCWVGSSMWAETMSASFAAVYQMLKPCLVHNKYSINICWMSWIFIFKWTQNPTWGASGIHTSSSAPGAHKMVPRHSEAIPI